MPQLKIILEKTQETGEIVTTTYGEPFSLDGAQTVSAQCNIDVDTPAAKTFAQGTRQVQQVATVADVSGSLNSKYFLLNSINTATEASKGFYVWFNINSAGVDPAIAGRTAIPITGATNVSANTLATSIRSALDALTSDFATTTGSNQNVIVNNLNPGLVTAAADGTAATGFNFSAPSTPGVATKVSVLNDTFTIASHGFITGNKLQATDTGTLPAGITTATDYFVIKVDANTIQLASSLSNAQAGTAINITDFGSNAGTGTLTPVAIAGASVKFQKSNFAPSQDIWSDEGSATNITADGAIYLEKVDPTAKWGRLAWTLTAGQISAASQIVVKGLN